jgi:hypothetical protein
MHSADRCSRWFVQTSVPIVRSAPVSDVVLQAIVAIRDDGDDFVLGRVVSELRVLDASFADADTTERFSAGSRVVEVRLLSATGQGGLYVEDSSVDTVVSFLDILCRVELQDTSKSSAPVPERRRSSRVASASLFGLTRWALPEAEHDRINALLVE